MDNLLMTNLEKNQKGKKMEGERKKGREYCFDKMIRHYFCLVNYNRQAAVGQHRWNVDTEPLL